MTSFTSILSTRNPQIKKILQLRKRPVRDEMELFIIEGYREIKEALAVQWPLEKLFICPDFFLGSNENLLIEQAYKAGTEILRSNKKVFSKISYRDRPDGLLAVGIQKRNNLENLYAGKNPLVLVAESIEKPGNLGTMLRTADAAGVDAFLVCDARTDIFNPNVVRASVGALFSIPLVMCGSVEAIVWLKKQNIQIWAASPDAEIFYYETNFSLPTALVVGSEQYGLSSQWLKETKEMIRIPMRGACDSLNVATSSAILLYEALRQRNSLRNPVDFQARSTIY